MATILARIKRAIRNGDFEIGVHCIQEAAADQLAINEVISAILNASEFDKLTDDESHIRYRIYGVTATEREIVIVVFFSQGTLFLKTVYETSF